MAFIASRRTAQLARAFLPALALSAAQIADAKGVSDAQQACAPVAVALGLPRTLADRDNPWTREKEALGRALFFDKRLSADQSIGCSSCHRPERGFTDGRSVAQGLGKRNGTRNTPTLLNAVFYSSQFWDGRRGSIEEQVLDPLFNPVEHGIADERSLLRLLRRDSGYRTMFEAAFGRGSNEVTGERVAKALATFVRTLIAGNSPFDRYEYGCDRAALSEPAIRGLALFRGRATCGACHLIGERDATFTDDRFHSVGVGLDQVAPRLAVLARQVVNTPKDAIDSLISRNGDIAALGRFVVTLKPSDIGKFRTPSLRNVALTAPYMHDGSVPTLETAIDRELYYRTQALGRPVILTPAEKRDLLVFLKSLTSVHLESLVHG